MKHLIILLVLLGIGPGCSKPTTFVLDDTEENKYFVAEFVHRAFSQDQINGSPLIVINGTPFKYNKEKDTITLPFKKSEAISLDFLNKNSSRIIYNEKENDGAVLIAIKNP